jgi:hypothetical protein
VPTDLLIYEVFDLPGLIQSGVVVPLGGLRYQFTREYLHSPAIRPKPLSRPRWNFELSESWKASRGAVIRLVDRSSPSPNSQFQRQPAFMFSFEIDGAHEAQSGPVQYVEPETQHAWLDMVLDQWLNLSTEAWLSTLVAPPSGIVSAGANQVVQSGGNVQLGGSLVNKWGQPLPFNWTQVDGPGVSLSDRRSLTPRFTAPVVVDQEILEFKLIATDGLNTFSATTFVTVNP